MESASASAVPLGASSFWLWCFSTISISKPAGAKMVAACFNSSINILIPSDMLADFNTATFFDAPSTFFNCSSEVLSCRVRPGSACPRCIPKDHPLPLHWKINDHIRCHITDRDIGEYRVIVFDAIVEIDSSTISISASSLQIPVITCPIFPLHPLIIALIMLFFLSFLYLKQHRNAANQHFRCFFKSGFPCSTAPYASLIS